MPKTLESLQQIRTTLETTKPDPTASANERQLAIAALAAIERMARSLRDAMVG